MARSLPMSAITIALCALSFGATVHAEGSLPCALLLPRSVEQALSPQRLHVVKTQKLFRTEQRPYALVPEGVAIWVRAPRGTTAADLHRRLSECSKHAGEGGTPICVQGARISVEHENHLYVVRVLSDRRSAAFEIQRRAQEL